MLRRGDLAAAETALSESLSAARSRSAGYEEALTLEVMAELVARSGRGPADELQAESKAVLTRLGVVSTPDLVRGVPASA
jgi:hypothetical protein